MYQIRIYTKSGHQIDLWVQEFTVTPNQYGEGYSKWQAKWIKNAPQLLALMPSQIEAVVVLDEREVGEELPADFGQQYL